MPRQGSKVDMAATDAAIVEVLALPPSQKEEQKKQRTQRQARASTACQRKCRYREACRSLIQDTHHEPDTERTQHSGDVG